ncbi:hypothetical protein B0H13DRAFT_2428746 [Mycena leptocephala]|nr:hypothetical protein B0H13DRAFT_2428746 [Mycena leptocephala]
MSATSRMHASYSTSAWSSKPTGALAETSRGSAFVFDPGQLPAPASCASSSSVAYWPLETDFDDYAPPRSDWLDIYNSAICACARVHPVTDEWKVLALHEAGFSIRRAARIVCLAKDIRARCVANECDNTSAVVGKQPTTPILLSATSIGCKPLDPRTAGAPATSASSRKHSTLFVENSGRPETRIIGRSDAGERPVKTAQMCGKRSKERDGNRGSVSGEFSVYISSPSSSILSATGLATPTSVSPSTAPILRASAQRSLASTTSLFPPPSAPALIPSPAPLTSPPFSACTRRGVLPPALLNRVHEASHTLAQLPIDSHAARLPSFISSRAATDAFALASTTAPQSAVHSVDAAHALPCAPAVPNGTHEASLAPEQVHGAPDHSVFASASAQQSAARRADSSPALLAPPSVPKISVVSGPPSNAEVVVARAPISMLPFPSHSLGPVPFPIARAPPLSSSFGPRSKTLPPDKSLPLRSTVYRQSLHHHSSGRACTTAHAFASPPFPPPSIIVHERVRQHGKDPPWRVQAHPTNSCRSRSSYAAFRRSPSARYALVFPP